MRINIFRRNYHHGTTVVNVRFVFFTEVTMKHAVLWNVAPFFSFKMQRFGGLYCYYHQSEKNQRARSEVFLRSVLQFRVTANVSSSIILFTLIMDAIRSSETSVLQEPHVVTSQKTTFFIVTAVKTSFLTQH
jgi:hypothetical protein